MKKSLFLFICIVSIISSSGVWGQTVIYHPGLYCLGASDTHLLVSSYQKPFVTGGAVRVDWASFNPSEDHYTWNFLDDEIDSANAAGKKISVYMEAGTGAPGWVLSHPGLNFFTYLDGTHTINLPLPYDQYYISKWCKFIDTFGKRYANNPTIVYVRGASESVTNGWGLPSTDINGHTWAGFYHFTTDTLLHTMEKVLDTFMAYFPTTPEWVEVGKIPFDNVGHNDIYIGEQIANYGFANYTDRFNVWREDFRACMPLNPNSNDYLHILKDNPCHNGAQAVWNVQDVNTVTCTDTPRMDKCDPLPICSKDTVMKRAIQRALTYQMTYLEIYKVDIIDPSLAVTLQNEADSLNLRSQACFDYVSVSPTSTNICAGGSATLTATGNGVPLYSYSWSPAAGLSAITGATVTASPTVTTTYTVTLTDGNGLTVRATTTVNVSAQPTTSITSTIPTALCSGNTTITPSYSGGTGSFVDYVWTSSDGSFATTSTAAVTPTPTTTTTYSVSVSMSAPGCTGTVATTTVTKAALPTTTLLASSTALCVGTVTLTPTSFGGSGTGSFIDYVWTSSTGVLNTTSTSAVTVTPAVTTTYSVTANYSGQGCSGTAAATTTVTIYGLPVTTVSPTHVTICNGTNTTLTPSYSGGTGSLVNYTWSKSGGGGTQTSTGPLTISPGSTNTYSVVVTTSGTGCIGTAAATATVTVNHCDPPGAIKLTPTNNGPVCFQCPVSLSCTATGGSGSYKYNWMGDEGSGLSSAITTANCNVTPVTSGDHMYTIIVTDANGKTATATTTVTVSPPDAQGNGNMHIESAVPFTWALYPNPTRDVINITVSASGNENLRFELADVTGRTLKTSSVKLSGKQTITMNVSDYPAGSYLITLSRDGKAYETKKITLIK